MRLFAPLVLAAPLAAASAQQGPPLRYLVAEMRIEGSALTGQNLWPAMILSVGRDGRVLLQSANASSGGIHGFAADGKPLQFQVRTGYRTDADISWAERGGRFGKDRYWIADPQSQHVALLSADAKISDVLPYPTWVHPKWSERRKFPIFGAMELLAMYPDSQMLVRPMQRRTLLDTPGYEPTLTHLLRINPNGQIQRQIAEFEEDTWQVVLRDGKRTHVIPVPFAARTHWSVADDGSRVTLALRPSSVADSGAVRIVSIGAQGDTIFDRRYPAHTIAVTAEQVGKALQYIRAYGPHSADKVREQLRRRIPAHRAFVQQVIAGYDGSTWVITRSPVDSVRTRNALILNERGEPIAHVTLPVMFSPMRADRSTVWGTDRAKPAVVRMKVQAMPAPITAQLPQSVKASAVKK